MPISYQDFDTDIDDVDHILFGQCCLAERLPQERFAVIAERFDFEKLAHGGQVFAPGLGNIVLPQAVMIATFANGGGDMIDDRAGYLV
jgi:hypothetical protein